MAKTKEGLPHRQFYHSSYRKHREFLGAFFVVDHLPVLGAGSFAEVCRALYSVWLLGQKKLFSLIFRL
ncbi:hypothetical protein SCG7086_DN_00030 [Chlamydiales bacterium SCGC AG-110-P3]|nr:hypothetical protein SCG7086_DN_00030 [Chlamydiales bacterium SCGC AG-110-P3]